MIEAETAIAIVEIDTRVGALRLPSESCERKSAAINVKKSRKMPSRRNRKKPRIRLAEMTVLC